MDKGFVQPPEFCTPRARDHETLIYPPGTAILDPRTNSGTTCDRIDVRVEWAGLTRYAESRAATSYKYAVTLQ